LFLHVKFGFRIEFLCKKITHLDSTCGSEKIALVGWIEILSNQLIADHLHVCGFFLRCKTEMLVALSIAYVEETWNATRKAAYDETEPSKVCRNT